MDTAGLKRKPANYASLTPLTFIRRAAAVHGDRAAIASASASVREQIHHRVNAMVAGAAPPAASLAEMSRMGFELRHVYGLTEVYGPAAVCEPQSDWEGRDLVELANLNARQGVRYHLQDAVDVLNP